MVFRWCMALIPLCTTPIAYITRLIAKIDTHKTEDKKERINTLEIAYRTQREEEQEEKQELGRED
jgi:hypothetical protein